MSKVYAAQTLETGNVVNLGPADGQRLYVHKGSAWITQGDERDLIVEAGQQIFLDGPGTALVTALESAVVYEVEHARSTALAA